MESPSDSVGYEPFPDFRNASKSWENIAWPCFVYGFGIAFALMGFTASYSTMVLAFAKTKPCRKTSRTFFIAINLQIVLLGLARALALLMDPYNMRMICPPIVYSILFNIGYPCLTSAFGLINWIIFQASKIRILSATKVGSIRFLVTVILIHYAIVLTVTLVTELVTIGTPVLIIICDGFFVIWGFILSIGFFYAAFRMRRLEKTTHKELFKHSDRSLGLAGVSSISGRGMMLSCTMSMSSARYNVTKSKFKKNSTSQAFDQSNPLPKFRSQSLGNLREYNNLKPTSNTCLQSFTHHEPHPPGPHRKPASRITRRQEQNRLMSTRCSLTTNRPRCVTGKVIKICAITAVLGFVASILHLYGILIVHIRSIRIGRTRPELWEWYAYNVLFRLIELAMGCTMAYFTMAHTSKRR